MRSSEVKDVDDETKLHSQDIADISKQRQLLRRPRRWRRTCTGIGGGCRTTTATTSTCGRDPSPSSGSAAPRPTCEPLPGGLRRASKCLLCRRCPPPGDVTCTSPTAAATMHWTGGWRRAAATRPASCGRATARPCSGPAPCHTGRCWTRPAAWCAAQS